MIGPVATPSPTTAPQMPRAAARSRRSRKVLLMIDRVVGKIRAAKVPIAKRATTRASAEWTSAPAALAKREADEPDDQRRPAAEAVRE